ncbi:hypothetical protein RV03_GL001876 [Enterococcus gallinarum]|nr:hypothetical protein RV03_GL001876 [Enterococcus gallinarum]
MAPLHIYKRIKYAKVKNKIGLTRSFFTESAAFVIMRLRK